MGEFDMTAPVLNTQGVVKRFSGLTAVDGVDIEIESGEIVGLIGPNGAGKTTLFNCITGVLSPDDGQVMFDSRDVTNESPDELALKGLIRTFQEPRIFPGLSVKKNLIAAQQRTGDLRTALLQRQDTDDVEADAKETATFVGLDELYHEKASALSLGQKKLLQFGMVLMPDPKIVLLDEPTAGVNPSMISDIIDLIQEVNEEGMTILLIEHNMDVIMELSERIYVLNSGQILAHGAPEEIQNNKQVLKAYLGEA